MEIRDQLLLSVYIYVYPNAKADKVYPFVHTNDENIYFWQRISDRCSALQYSRKRTSRE